MILTMMDFCEDHIDIDADEMKVGTMTTMLTLVIGTGGSRLPEAQRNNGNGNFHNDQILQGEIIMMITLYI